MFTEKLIYILVLMIMLSVPTTGFSSETYFTGFLQGLYGGGIDNENPTPSDLTASETRLQLRMESFSDNAEFFGRIDFVYDDYYQPSTDIELREGFAKFRIGSFLDFKIGRQIVTWGTGDLIFINDVFAKDYLSFFTGRDDQYLKAPQNALRMSMYTSAGDISIVYSPRFTPNRTPTGERLSYFNPMTPSGGEIVGAPDYLFEENLPESNYKNGELAGRFSRYFGNADVALYGYRGFYKNPVGFDMTTMTGYYPRLNVYGASVRMPVFGGIAWIEGGFFDSRDDVDGNNPMIPNSKISALVGFERQIGSNLTANIQYQNEKMVDFDKYVATLPVGMVESDETYHLLTTRITQLFMMETLSLSAFVFYSPNEEDFYGRFLTNYKYSDAVTLSLGANIFDGKMEYTSFGTFQKNDNIYLKVTYGY
ncbi:MAG: hypothetical protein GY865_16215 [candidate division Zixibacteria bacterium]|nr:hypothetical protein [candidate division Zixibacteria bacterium]